MALVIDLEEVHERVAHPLHLPIGHARNCLCLSVALGQSPSLNCRSPLPIYRKPPEGRDECEQESNWRRVGDESGEDERQIGEHS